MGTREALRLCGILRETRIWNVIGDKARVVPQLVKINLEFHAKPRKDRKARRKRTVTETSDTEANTNRK